MTGQVEAQVLRGPMWAVRAYREMKSRTKHRDAPATYPVTIEKAGTLQTVELPAAEYPILLFFPDFNPPGLLSPSHYPGIGISVRGHVTISYGPTPEEVMRRLGATKIQISQNHKPAEFARMIAKIAHAYAAATGDLRLIEGEPFVPRDVLGQSNTIGKWVGTLSYPLAAQPEFLHCLAIHRDGERGLLIGEVQLFSDSPTPRYAVLLGKLASPL